MTLTEQWEKGELKEGWYYIRNKAHSIKFNQMAFFMVFGEVSYWTNCKDEDIEEVLAPVPSYEEWEQLHKFLEEFNALDVAEENEALKTKLSIQCEANEEFRKENQQLKELLKECREKLKYCVRETYELQTKIDNAIGEKK